MLRTRKVFFVFTMLFMASFIASQTACDRATTNSQKPKVKRADNSPTSSATQIYGSLDAQHYYIANSISWGIENDVFLTAMIETRKSLSDPIQPASKFTVRNLSTNAILYQRELNGMPLNVYTRNITPDSNPELIVEWNIAAVSNQLQVFSVSSLSATTILDENYRVDVAFIDLGKDAIDILVTTGERGMGPFTTTLYTYLNGKYVAAGEVPYETLTSKISNLIIPMKQRH